MSEGFNTENLKISLNKKEFKNIFKKYKNIKKYMKSSIYAIKSIDGTETYVKKLIEESKMDNG